EFVHFHAGEALSTEFKYGFSLYIAEAEASHQSIFRIMRCGGFAYEFDNGIEIIECNQVTLEDMCFFLGFSKFVFGTAHNHFVAMVHKVYHEVADVECYWATMH